MADSTSKEPVKLPEAMKKIDLEKDFLSPRDRMYIEKMNMARVLAHTTKAQKAKAGRRNIFVGLGLAAMVMGAYAYSFYAVGQESFLDDFDDPDKPKD